jgi:hypothetical protein
MKSDRYKPSRSPEEKKDFYENGLSRLQTEELSELTGALIAKLIEVKPSRRLISYAQRWLTRDAAAMKLGEGAF